MATPNERRRFQRVAFAAKTRLEQGALQWPTRLIDVSLKGLLLETPKPFAGATEASFTAQIELGPQLYIEMQLRLSHQTPEALGFVCTHIDIDSITHLRRLLELNLGDAELLERELSALS